VPSAAERPALPAAGGTRIAHETDKPQSHEKSHFGGVNPAVRVHALLGAFSSDNRIVYPQAQLFNREKLSRKSNFPVNV
jgi:hypothetical protein